MAAAALAVGAGMPTANAASERPLFISIGTPARAPIGWLEFCAEYAPNASARAAEARDVVLSQQGLEGPGADQQMGQRHASSRSPTSSTGAWSRRWNYPDDGYGDCEDYVLLKRRMLMQAGWPRQALLITVVRDKQGDGHAVLTVKTDKGEFILDNQNDRHPAVV